MRTPAKLRGMVPSSYLQSSTPTAAPTPAPTPAHAPTPVPTPELAEGCGQARGLLAGAGDMAIHVPAMHVPSPEPVAAKKRKIEEVNTDVDVTATTVETAAEAATVAVAEAATSAVTEAEPPPQSEPAAPATREWRAL